MFAFSTMLAWSYYDEKSAGYLFGVRSSEIRSYRARKLQDAKA